MNDVAMDFEEEKKDSEIQDLSSFEAAGAAGAAAAQQPPP